jgi:hypothetical protein
LVFFAVLQNRLEATFGRRTSDGMVSEIASHPTEPIRIAVLADQEGHPESASCHKGQENILVPEQVQSWLGKAFGRHVRVIGVVGHPGIERPHQCLEKLAGQKGEWT